MGWLITVHDRVQHFAQMYRRGLNQVCATELPVTVCTIYNGDFDVATGEQQAIRSALQMWNGEIIQAAIDHDCPVIDLRRVCTQREDFTRQIEPSERGGRRIAQAIAAYVQSPDSFGVRIGPSSKPSEKEMPS